MKAPFSRCLYCKGSGWESTHVQCKHCDGVGFFNVPIGPTSHRPGSKQRIAVMAARVRRGKNALHSKDAPCKSH